MQLNLAQGEGDSEDQSCTVSRLVIFSATGLVFHNKDKLETS